MDFTKRYRLDTTAVVCKGDEHLAAKHIESVGPLDTLGGIQLGAAVEDLVKVLGRAVGADQAATAEEEEA